MDPRETEDGVVLSQLMDMEVDRERLTEEGNPEAELHEMCNWTVSHRPIRQLKGKGQG